MLAVGFSIGVLYQVEEVPFYSYFVECFYHWGIEFCQMVFLHLLRWLCVFCLSWCGVLHWFPRAEPALHFHTKSTWLWYRVLFTSCWVWFTRILSRIFVSVFIRGVMLVCSFLCIVLSFCCWCQGNAGFIERVGKCNPSSVFGKSLGRVSVVSS